MYDIPGELLFIGSAGFEPLPEQIAEVRRAACRYIIENREGAVHFRGGEYEGTLRQIANPWPVAGMSFEADFGMGQRLQFCIPRGTEHVSPSKVVLLWRRQPAAGQSTQAASAKRSTKRRRAPRGEIASSNERRPAAAGSAAIN